jgi:hypothetical protein
MAKKSENEENGVEEKEKKEETKQKNEQEIVWPYITFVTIYYILLGSLLISNLVSIWPADLEAVATAAERVRFFFRTMAVTNEIRMFLIVTMTGALGSLVHGFRSLFWYVGNRAYAKSWTLMYLLLPFVGSTLSLVFYLVLRGGLFSPQASVAATSPFGFAGIAGLVGMFSNQAALKLQEVAESIFATKQSTKGKDNVDSKPEKTAGTNENEES